MFRTASSIRNSSILFTTIQTIRLAIVIIAIAWSCEGVSLGQGQLANVRKATRQPKSTPARVRTASKPTAPKPSRNKDRNDDRDERREQVNDRPSTQTGELNSVRRSVRAIPNSSRSERHRTQPSRPTTRHRNARDNRRPVVIARPPRYCPPPVVVHQPVFDNHFYPAPVFVPSTTVISPLLIEPPTMSAPPSIPQLREHVVIEPMIIEPQEQHAASIGRDWFESTDSRLWATLGGDFDDLCFGSIGLHLQANRGLGIDASVSTIRESGMSIRDHLWLGDASLVYQIVRRPRLKTHLGVGVNWLGDSFGGAAGMNLTAGIDVKLAENWSLTGEGDIGTLGDADFLHTKVALNRQFDSLQWTVGYEAYDIGGAKLDSVFTGFVLRF